MRSVRIAFLLPLFLLLLPAGSLRMTPVQELAVPWAFSVVSYEVSSFPEKWLYKLRHLFGSPSREERLQDLHRYFELGKEQRRLQGRLQKVAAQEGNNEELQEAQRALEELLGERDALRRGVEEFIEGQLSAVLREQGLVMEPLGVRLQFPPVDLRFTEQPRLLVISPRDEIRRDASHLMEPRMTVDEMEALEEAILKEFNLSALVEGTGGVATYPAVIPSTRDLRGSLRTSAHEWLHHYLWFFPLGRNYNANGEMRTLNESLADIAGDELGDVLFVRLGGELPPERPQTDDKAGEEEEGFNFRREMHETRLQVDALLADGNVEEAERYMEERRQFLLGNGVHIRKLNQAYFAFHGTYADSPASVSPAGDQLRELRQQFDSLGDFVKALARVGEFQEFQELLQEAGVEG